MSTITERKVIPIVDRTPGKRCSDYDEDCVLVVDHYACWSGYFYNELFGPLEQADGYCPFLIGAE